MPKVMQFVPEDIRALGNIVIGSLIDINGKLYILVAVDPWSGYVVQYTWWREALDRLGYWISDKTGRGYRGFVERSHLVAIESHRQPALSPAD